MFGMRFLIQWIASERAKRSIVPIYFWYFSVAGSVFLLAYAIFRKDPVFIAGETVALLIFLRNLMLIQRKAAGSTVANRQ